MTRARFAVTTLLVATVVAVPAGSDPARAFLAEAFAMSAADIARVDAGHVVTRTLASSNSREVATLGIVRLRTTPAVYVERLVDIAAFKRTEDVLQIAKFGSPARFSDVAGLSLEEADLNVLRDCRVGDCGLRLSADGIERLQREIDWRAPDATRRAGELVRQQLVDYVTQYRAGGVGASIEYAATSTRLHVGREFAALVDADTTTWKYLPRLRRHVLEYPGGEVAASDFVYWSKEQVHSREVVSITHVAIVPAAEPSPVSHAIASKQIYAMHYFDASLGLTLLVPITDSTSPGTYVVYLNRSRVDLFDGLLGGVARRIVAGRARTLVGEQLGRLQRVLAGAV